jgi:hypothetical protein
VSRRWSITLLAVGAVLFIGLIIYFVVVGLEEADRSASVVGALATVLSLVVGGLGFRRARRQRWGRRRRGQQ